MLRQLIVILPILMLAACSMNSMIKPSDNSYRKSHSAPLMVVPDDLVKPEDREIFFVPEGRKETKPPSLVPPGSILQKTGKT